MFVRNENFNDYIKLYPIITCIAAIHTVLFGIAALPYLPNDWIFEKLIGANIYIKQGELWRFVSPLFVHVNFSHFIFNTIALLIFAPPLEKKLGKIVFSCFYLLCGITGNLFAFLLLPLTYVHTGSSGAIFGIFGFYLASALFGKNPTSRSAQVILPVLIISLFMSFIQPGVNITAHLAGLFTGVAAGILLRGKLES
ncbi:rhomboid family intramembrane serine protease [Falsibacillus pallidus]|uniref:rhomboid family intramembrane serine protease n=1 Tax=Falsibacillus pallidus TaxID=493781 RepID=UPI003D9805A9